MHSTIIALIATTAGFAAATPLAYSKEPECPSTARNATYYVCGNNGFRGYCSIDPCAKPWCPDFKLKTCSPATPPYANTTTVYPGTTSTSTRTSTTTSCSGTSTSTTPCPGTPTPPVCSGTAPYYVCAKNGFKGSCSVDPCALDWCPDYEAKTCNVVEHPPPETPCTGCPKTPCTDCTKATCTNCTKTTCKGPGAFYVCANNGFRGNCSVDPCALSWCPDYETKTCEATVACGPKETKSGAGENKGHKTERQADNGVCPEGTGYYQVCGNGFRGCCKADACGQTSPICPSEVLFNWRRVHQVLSQRPMTTVWHALQRTERGFGLWHQYSWRFSNSLHIIGRR